MPFKSREKKVVFILLKHWPGASLDIRGIPAHWTDSFWGRSVLFVGVFCEEMCFVRVWKTTQRFENPTRVLKKLKKIEKNLIFLTNPMILVKAITL